ncbi:MAG TPA: YhgE/Pip domain-containing protein [Eggerthellaceae bacterium]|nr:YhgE/Pip domain-containing protein [Eggerthellaceae bacterium]
MRNIWLLFKGDLRRLRSNVVTVIAIVGLVALPSIFSWYNMLACWNVFDNTGNLKVAVANCDEGYEGDLLALRVNIGDQVVKGLRENDQMNWVFTDQDDAVDGARSGRYYAAIVIPESFSRDMMSFYSDDVEHASIVYYSNEKKNAVAPKVTDQGADRIARTINESFTETLTEVGLALATSLVKHAETADLDDVVGKMSDHLDNVADELADAASIVRLYGGVVASAGALVQDADAMATDVRGAVQDGSHAADGASAAVESVPASVQGASDALKGAIADCADSYRALPDSLVGLFDGVRTTRDDAATQLRTNADDVDAIAQDLQTVVTLLQRLDQVARDADGSIDAAIDRLNALVALQERLYTGLNSAADAIEGAGSTAKDDRDQLVALAQQVSSDLDALHADFDANLAPALADLGTSLDNLKSSLAEASVEMDEIGASLSNASSTATRELGEAREKLDGLANRLDEGAATMRKLSGDLLGAAKSGDPDAIRAVLGQSPEVLAQVLSAPIQMQRTAVFPSASFGSSMSPLYTTLALWIGALLVMVTLKLTPSERVLAELRNPTKRQVFIGRYGVVALISLLQSSTIALGNLFFLGVQAVHPWLYLLCFWISGLVFSFIIYAFTALLGNLGKAISVVLLIVQVSGGGGSFPMQLLPDFFQWLNPYLPIAHAVNAMRAAMFGVYANDFWIEIGTLVAFAVPLLLMGTVLIKPLSVVIPKFVERVEESKLM